jgi:hypothetical protein
MYTFILHAIVLLLLVWALYVVGHDVWDLGVLWGRLTERAEADNNQRLLPTFKRGEGFKG